MAITLRIVSADGKRAVMKVLPGLPAKIKVPPGAKVDVTEDGHTMSLAQYINQHSNRHHHDKDGHDDAKVSIEPVQDWGTAEAWLDAMGSSARAASASRFF